MTLELMLLGTLKLMLSMALKLMLLVTIKLMLSMVLQCYLYLFIANMERIGKVEQYYEDWYDNI